MTYFIALIAIADDWGDEYRLKASDLQQGFPLCGDDDVALILTVFNENKLIKNNRINLQQYLSLGFHYYILYYSSELDQDQYQIPVFVMQCLFGF